MWTNPLGCVFIPGNDFVFDLKKNVLESEGLTNIAPTKVVIIHSSDVTNTTRVTDLLKKGFGKINTPVMLWTEIEIGKQRVVFSVL